MDFPQFTRIILTVVFYPDTIGFLQSGDERMTSEVPSGCTAFAGERRIASGSLMHVAMASKTVVDHDPNTLLLVFDDSTSRLVELDLRGSLDAVRGRVEAVIATTAAEANESAKKEEPAQKPSAKRGPGRPKLGVVSKEVTLLPRHWEFLQAQTGGASATLRRLVEQARKERSESNSIVALQESTYRFMVAMVGNQPGFEEANRALYARDRERFMAESEGWPQDLRKHARMLAERVL